VLASLTYVKNANQIFDKGRYLMCTKYYRTAQCLKRAITLLNYSIRRLVFLINPNRPINSCLDTIMHTVDEAFILTWANSDSDKANSIHYNNHVFSLY